MADDRKQRAFDVLAHRGVWEQKQRIYYQLRHDGLRRLNKPWDQAADAHFPLIDMNVANLKPFWMSQALVGERLTDFIALKQQLNDFTESAADYYSFHLRYETDWRYRLEQAVDTMILRGRGIFKAGLNPWTKKLVFKCVDPLYMLVAEQYDDLDDADWFVEIQALTASQYKRNRNFNPDVLDQIRGKSLWQLESVRLDKQVREGVTHSMREDVVMLWNWYEKTDSGWIVSTHCPLKWDLVIRKPFHLNLKWQGETLLPFVSLTMEIKDEGWYSPRGVAELNAAFEGYCCKLWNEKSDAMTFGNRPIFTSASDIPNSANWRMMPGEIVPGNLQAVQMPPPAFSFGEELNFTRQVAEQRAKMPDFGVYGQDQQGGGKPRTATENARIAGLQDVGADHNGELFRQRLTKIHRLIWALICQREENCRAEGKPSPLTYYASDNLKTLPEQALHDQYLVIPAGSGGTKQQRLQRALARYQLFVGKPNINQDELAKDVLSADDSRLINRLLMPSNIAQSEEAENEAMEIGIMLLGFPAAAKPGEDHITRIKVLVGFLQKQAMTGAPVDPIAVQRLQQHLAVHFQLLKEAQPQAAKQLHQDIMAMEQQSMQPQAMQMPQNGNGNGMPPPDLQAQARQIRTEPQPMEIPQ